MSEWRICAIVTDDELETVLALIRDHALVTTVMNTDTIERTATQQKKGGPDGYRALKDVDAQRR